MDTFEWNDFVSHNRLFNGRTRDQSEAAAERLKELEARTWESVNIIDDDAEKDVATKKLEKMFKDVAGVENLESLKQVRFEQNCIERRRAACERQAEQLCDTRGLCKEHTFGFAKNLSPSLERMTK